MNEKKFFVYCHRKGGPKQESCDFQTAIMQGPFELIEKAEDMGPKNLRSFLRIWSEVPPARSMLKNTCFLPFLALFLADFWNHFFKSDSSKANLQKTLDIPRLSILTLFRYWCLLEILEFFFGLWWKFPTCQKKSKIEKTRKIIFWLRFFQAL